MNLVDIGLLRGELDIVLDLLADGPEKLVVDEVMDYGVLVRCGLGVLGGVGFVNRLVEESFPEAFMCFFGR